jgi:hypothetical protein
MDVFYKQPAEVLDYDVTTENWLSEGDFIITATSAVSPAGLTIQSTTVINNGTAVKVWTSGGTSGVRYTIELTMTTDDGRVKNHVFQLAVKEI